MTDQRVQAPSDLPPPEAPPPGDRQPGRLIELAPHRRLHAEMRREDGLNAEWDELVVAVADAWCWRDPESLAALEQNLARVRARVLEDWGEGYPARKG